MLCHCPTQAGWRRKGDFIISFRACLVGQEQSEHTGFFVANDNMSLCRREAIVTRTGLDCVLILLFLSLFILMQVIDACHLDYKPGS